MRTLTGDHVQKLIKIWEQRAEESIKQIQNGHLPQIVKNQHMKEIIEEFHKDRLEAESLAVRTELRMKGSIEDIKAEIVWAELDMKSERCQNFLRETYLTHLFELSALLAEKKDPLPTGGTGSLSPVPDPTLTA